MSLIWLVPLVISGIAMSRARVVLARLVDRGVDPAQVGDDTARRDQALAGLPYLVVDEGHRLSRLADSLRHGLLSSTVAARWSGCP